LLHRKHKFVEELCGRCGQRVIAFQGLDECPICGGELGSIFDRKAVYCSVLEKTVTFAQCLVCSNFIQTAKGKVGCKGLPLPNM
jgi:hypothetical protein